MEFSPTCHWSQEEYFKFQETRIIDQRIFLGGLIKVGSFSGIKTMERFMVGKKNILGWWEGGLIFVPIRSPRHLKSIVFPYGSLAWWFASFNET